MAAADGKLKLDNKKTKLLLNDANAIVRYYPQFWLTNLDIFMKLQRNQQLRGRNFR